MDKGAVITVQFVLQPGETAKHAAKLIELASGYMDLVERLPEEGKGWNVAGRVSVFREDVH